MTVKINITPVILSIILVQSLICVSADDEAPVVVTSLGTIRGVRATDGEYSMFMGIPFAKVNESNIFGDAIPYPNFDGVFEANDDSVACPQIEEFNDTFTGSLDCLNLNIYVPDSYTSQGPLPVMLYIFGGSFELGFASRFILGPKFLVRHDVLFVTINYRLGPYGFMCLHTPEVPGNQGLRDQIMGMRWVQEHIAAFGGNPSRVTLFGNSAGSMSVDYHVLSEAETLYNGVILQSGTAFFSQLSGADRETPLRLAEALGLETTDLNEALEYIATLEVSTVIQTVSDAGLNFFTCREADIEGVTRVIANNAVNLQLPKTAGLNVMIGSTDDELLIFFASVPPEAIPLFGELLGSLLDSLFIFDDDTKQKAERYVRNFYIGDEDVTADVIYELGDFLSDLSMIYPTERTIRQYLNSDAEVYYYIFAYSGERNFNKVRNGIDLRGAYHADELGYLFDMKIMTDEPSPDDQLIIDRMTTLWTNFAKYGDPTPETTELLPVKWQPITKGSVYHYLNITTDINTARRPFNQRMIFWDLFYEAFGKYERTLQANVDELDNVDSVDEVDIDEVDVDDTSNNAFGIVPSLFLTTLIGAVSQIVISLYKIKC